MKKYCTIVTVSKDKKIDVLMVYKLSSFDKLFKKFDDSYFFETVRALGGKSNNYNVELIHGCLYITSKLEERDDTIEENYNSYLMEDGHSFLAKSLLKDKTIYRVLKWIVGFGIGALILTLIS